MARPSTAGAISEVYENLDDGWRDAALCRGEGLCQCSMGVAWTIMPGEKYEIGGSRYKGETLVQLALQICERCPVQWDCAEFAVRTGQQWGTWGMHPNAVHAFTLGSRSKQRGLALIDSARRRGVPVQMAISATRDPHLIASPA